jgi:hypothetical protein
VEFSAAFWGVVITLKRRPVFGILTDDALKSIIEILFAEIEGPDYGNFDHRIAARRYESWEDDFVAAAKKTGVLDMFSKRFRRHILDEIVAALPEKLIAEEKD